MTNVLATDLMSEILSRNDYITLVAHRINQVSDAKNLLNFVPHMLHHYSLLPNHDSATKDLNQRARRFMLALISKTHNKPSSNVPDDPHSNMLALVLYILNNKEVRKRFERIMHSA